MDMNSPALQMTVFLTPVIFLYKELLKCLVLLKSAFFSPDWHSSIYKEACHQLNEEHVSALLQMLQPQLSVDERMEGAGVSDMSYEKHFLEHFHKA